MRILVADDSRLERMLLSKQLQRWGYNDIVFACQGQEALDILLDPDQRPALAIIDWMMPQLSGNEVIQRLRSQAPEPYIYTLLCTGRDSKADLLTGLQSGADDYLTKPVDPDELKLRVSAGQRLLQAIQQQQHLEVQLRHAQKMEAVGQLAAGIAHELNTPIQFLSDTLLYMQDACQELLDACQSYQQHMAGTAEQAALAAAVTAQYDLDFHSSQIPKALERTSHGLQRVTHITQAMRSFSRKDAATLSPANLNQALDDTLVVTQHVYSMVANIDKHYAELPDVTCNVGDINQVFLNLIVNAAHAIAAKQQAPNAATENPQGTIRITTRADHEHVMIDIQDSGTGIPKNVQARIFEPFFTTKDVGQGTGQGLALAHSIIVEKHGGTLSFTTTPGEGTTFTIHLPHRTTQQAAA